MTPEQLRNSILQYAIEGKLVEQRPEEGTGEELYQGIQKEKTKRIKNGQLRRTKKLPEIDKSRFQYEFPDSWKLCYVDDIAFVTKLAGFEYTKNIAPNLSLSGIPLFKGKNIKNSELNYEFESYIPEDVSDELSRSQINKKCLLTPYVGTIGNIAIFEGKFKAHLGSNVGKIELLNGDRQFILEEYVLYYLRSKIGYYELTKYKKATAQESISIDAIRNVYIPLPPLGEQKRIVAKIEELQPYIDSYAKAWNKLEIFNSKFPEDMKKSILQYAIEGKLVEQRSEEGTAEELYQRIQEEKKKFIKEGKIKKEKALPEITEDEIPFDIPDNWKWVRLDEVVGKNIKRGKSPKYSENSNVLVFAQKCNTKAGIIDLELAKYLDEEKLKSYPESEYMRDKDIVVNSTGNGTLGRIGIYKSSDNKRKLIVVPDSHVTIIRGLNCVEIKYIYYYLKANQRSFEKMGNGSTNQTELKPYTLRNALLPLPPLEEQKRIVTRIEELLPLCDQLIK